MTLQHKEVANVIFLEMIKFEQPSPLNWHNLSYKVYLQIVLIVNINRSNYLAKQSASYSSRKFRGKCIRDEMTVYGAAPDILTWPKTQKKWKFRQVIAPGSYVRFQADKLLAVTFHREYAGQF